MTTLTVEQVSETLEEIVAEHGADYYYPQANESCFYTERGPGGVTVPSCIVGHVVARLDPDTFKKIAVYEADGDTLDARNLPSLVGLDMEADAVEALQQAQFRQDEGESWGGALQAYYNSLEAGVHA